MLMADTMAIFFVVLGLMLALVGFWLLCRGVWQEAVGKAVERCRRGFVRPFLVGLPLSAVTLLATIGVNNVLGSLGKLLAVGLVCLYMFYAHIGVAGLATYLGQRLTHHASTEQPWKTTVRGGTVLVLSYLLPIIGWFFLLPLTFIIGCGLTTLSLRRERVAPLPAVEPSPTQHEAPHFSLGNSLSEGSS